MHSRKVFIFKDVNYGASKSSATLNTATSPELLAEGALGIYGIDPLSANNAGKLALITDGGSDAAGLVPVASFKGKEIFIAMGTANGVQISGRIDVSGIQAIESAGYAAATLGVTTITLDWPGTVLKGDLVSIGITNKSGEIYANRQPFEKERYSVEVAAGSSAYAAAVGIVNAVARVDAANRLIAVPKVGTTTSGSAAANSATLSAVNGATTMTASAAHGIGVGDYVKIDGDVYQAVTGTATTTLVIDRPYKGATATVANAAFLDLGTTLTDVQLVITDKEAGQNIEASVQGIIEDSVIVKTVASNPGKGTIAQVTALEKEALPKKGSHDQITSYMPLDTLKVDTSLNGYDLYSMTIHNANHPNGDPGSVFKVLNYVTLAFPEGVADTAGKNQSNFEDIMVVLYPAFVTTF